MEIFIIAVEKLFKYSKRETLNLRDVATFKGHGIGAY
jgi:hypothetical protein